MICLTACVASIWAPGSPFDAQIEFNSTFHDSFTTRNASFPSGDVHVATGDITSYASIMLLMAGITAARLGPPNPYITQKKPKNNQNKKKLIFFLHWQDCGLQIWASTSFCRALKTASAVQSTACRVRWTRWWTRPNSCWSSFSRGPRLSAFWSPFPSWLLRLGEYLERVAIIEGISNNNGQLIQMDVFRQLLLPATADI